MVVKVQLDAVILIVVEEESSVLLHLEAIMLLIACIECLLRMGIAAVALESALAITVFVISEVVVFVKTLAIRTISLDK